MLYRGMDRAQLDAAYNSSAAVPERDAIVADWAARSAKVRHESGGRLDLAYGDTRASGSICFSPPIRRRRRLCLSTERWIAPSLCINIPPIKRVRNLLVQTKPLSELSLILFPRARRSCTSS